MSSCAGLLMTGVVDPDPVGSETFCQIWIRKNHPRSGQPGSGMNLRKTLFYTIYTSCTKCGRIYDSELIVLKRVFSLLGQCEGYSVILSWMSVLSNSHV